MVTRMTAVQFYKHMGQCKELAVGTKINDVLAYTSEEDGYTVHHTPTGMVVTKGKRMKEVIATAMHLIEVNAEAVSKRANTKTLESLPTESELEEFENELTAQLKLRKVPFEPYTYAVKQQLVIDFVALERIISARKDYNKDHSLQDNILNMYGNYALNLISKFELVL